MPQDPCCMNPDHPQRKISYENAQRTDWQDAEVDEGIADLLLALWKRGVHTRYSCQGHPEKKRRHLRNAYIMFHSPEDAARFAAHLTPDAEVSQYALGVLEFANHYDNRVKEHPESWVWQHQICPHPYEEMMKEEPRFTCFELTSCVRFPPEHIPAILKALRPEGWPLKVTP